MKRILIVLMLLTSTAYADCASDLVSGGKIPSTTAQVLCATFGSAATQSIIPDADNTYDLGSSSLGWRTAYVDTSVVTPLVVSPGTADLTVKIDDDPQRLHTFGASSDTALVYAFGDAGVTATQLLSIRAATADADDDALLCLSGGGGCNDGARGGSIALRGEESSGGGDITYNAGASDTHIFQAGDTTEITLSDDAITFAGAAASVVGGATSLTVGSSGSTIIRADADPQRLFTFDAASDTALTQTFGDAGVTAAQVFTLSASTSDADDDSTLQLSGGGAYANDGTRGGGLFLSGNDNSNGDTVLNAGAISGGDVVISAPAANGNVYMQTAGTTKWTTSSTGTFIGAGTATIGWALVSAANQACTTTCVTPCVMGFDTAVSAIPGDCAAATSDICLCAGAT